MLNCPNIESSRLNLIVKKLMEKALSRLSSIFGIRKQTSWAGSTRFSNQNKSLWAGSNKKMWVELSRLNSNLKRKIGCWKVTFFQWLVFLTFSCTNWFVSFFYLFLCRSARTLGMFLMIVSSRFSVDNYYSWCGFPRQNWFIYQILSGYNSVKQTTSLGMN